MKKIIITEKEKDLMNKMHSGFNSKTYELDGNVYKFFSDNYKYMSDENLLRIKLEMSDELNLPGIIIPNGILINEEGNLLGARYPKVGTEFKLYTSDLQTCTKRHVGISKILQNASNQDVVLPDFLTSSNFRLNSDGTIFIIDYDGMQVKEIPTSGRSGGLDDFFINNLFIGEKYFDVSKKISTGYNLWTKEVNVFNSIVFYFMDCLGIVISTIKDNTEFYISKLGLEEDEINQKIWKIFSPYPNEYFTDDEFNLINDKYDLKPMPDLAGCKRFVRK